ncbi:Membrane protein [Minicystis rosea]|nr:Membrane protein [Minicystis rosea]
MLALLVAAPVHLAGAAVVAARLLPSPRPTRDRLAAAALLALACPILLVRVLGAAGALTAPALTVATIALGLAAVAASGRAARASARADLTAIAATVLLTFTHGATLASAWIGLFALGLAALAAYLLPPWAWDALGYHLPVVYDALQTHALREVPTHIPYVNAYPHAVEHFFIACRLLLGSDALLDFCQAPFALAACIGIAALARRAGAPAARAAAFGALFLALPLVMLQLASSYVDVAVAALLVLTVYFATGPLAKADLALFAVAAGLLLDSKPSAPPAVAVVGLVVLVRAYRARVAGLALAASLLALVIGGQTYAVNLLHHHNPVWPVSLRLGPIALPGLHDAGPMFVLGLPEPYKHYGWLHRLLASLVALPDRYIYDMRIGGLGPLVAAGLVPVAVVTARHARRAALPLLVLAVAAVASPAAHWMRYTLALPAALLAHVAATTARLAPRPRAAVDLALAALAALGIAQAAPGFTDGGPSIAKLLAMPAAARASAVSVDGHEAEWQKARALVRDGEAFAYDASFSFPGQLWRGDPAASVHFLGDASGDVDEALDRARVRILVAGDDLPAAAAVTRHPARYRLLFRCPIDRCNVYERRESEAASADRSAQSSPR